MYVYLSIIIAFFLTNTCSAYDKSIETNDTLIIATSSNFVTTLNKILSHFDNLDCKNIKISSGSTGKLTTQILQGAPYHIFLSADLEHPKILEERGYGVKDSRFTYALGKLVLWAPQKSLNEDIQVFLEDSHFHRITIANPKLAPYGLAASQYLKRLKLWVKLKPKLILGENINQTFHFLYSGNAQVGIVSLAQIIQLKNKDHTLKEASISILPDNMYPPIEQQALLLRYGEHHACAHQFMEFLKKDHIKHIIHKAGYRTPNASNLS